MIFGGKKRPCMVECGSTEIKALLIGFFVNQWTHGSSVSLGGFPAGQEAAPYALLQYEDGNIGATIATKVRLLGSDEEFGKYDWKGAEK